MVTIPSRSQTAGIPSQYDDTITATDIALITGDTPAIVTEDVLFAASQTLLALTVVGKNDAGAMVPATLYPVAGVRAIGALTFSGTGTAADTVTIGARVYTLVAAPASANEVKIGATSADTAANLIAAINGAAGAGTLYGTGTVPHVDVTARVNSASVVGVVAKVAGTAGNAIATTETGTGTAFGASTLTGGAAGIGAAPAGIAVIAVTTDGSSTLKGAPIYRAGVFNPLALVWDASFDTEAKKLAAFHNAPTPTNIILRRPKTASV